MTDAMKNTTTDTTKTPIGRRFWSYGPIDTDDHFYAPRRDLIDSALTRLVGHNPSKSGEYITVWAPRQCGKSWIMQQVMFLLQKDSRFDVVKLNLENLKDKKNAPDIIAAMAKALGEKLGLDFPHVDNQQDFQKLFGKDRLLKPLILILDEFDALKETGINTIVSAFRNIYMDRRDEKDKPTEEKSYLLHAVALIGVRRVLGVEDMEGSPFNVQQSLHIPNLSEDEVTELFKWYETEYKQAIHKDVVRRLFYETRGQPGLTCWFGELLTDTYNKDKTAPIKMEHFEDVYAAAANILPNNNILNIISKAKKDPYKDTVLKLFKTDKKMEFAYGNPELNYLYMNGVIDCEAVNRTEYVVRFASPFVQKSLFYYFSTELFSELGQLTEPFDNLDDTVTETDLHIGMLVKRYQDYLTKNKKWLLADVPRRKDLRIYEAVFHFNLYAFLKDFLKPWNSRVFPEFPTGNGKIDLLIQHAGVQYGIELKSFSTEREYKEALRQAAKYGKQLKLKEIHLIFFVETIDTKSREKYESTYIDKQTKVTVNPRFVETN